ncbi:MAG TPA: NAD(P)H-dependent glycerol-3-phosphate dehydrogenase [Pyrinomonadaceae bacterium]|jgi:glycerol-3-phosphate dehydrogenase (NAD(P)+)|nr:NAD(P)H-dependent glycerol-3-phosphate dehydrogenase [Pyrinomonadaceae bacterium]
MKQIAIIGAGNWGTALAIVAARAGHEVKLWSRDAGVVKSINEDRINSRYLSSASIPPTVTATNDLGEALQDASLILFAAPSHTARELLTASSPVLRESPIIVSVSKGIEIETGKRISEIAKDVISVAHSFVCLSGPSFAKEVIAGHPTAIVAASKDSAAARAVQNDLSFENLRIYTNSDVIGTEIGGSVKNVMAIAAGMTIGLGFGSNSVAALITRGLAEITRLARREGAQIETLMGLAGLGDLVLTCTGNLSRNRFVGEELGKGKTLAEITAGMNEVAEGINTARAVKRLAERASLEMPITNEVNAVLYDGKPARDAVAELMSRPLREEIH